MQRWDPFLRSWSDILRSGIYVYATISGTIPYHTTPHDEMFSKHAHAELLFESQPYRGISSK